MNRDISSSTTKQNMNTILIFLSISIIFVIFNEFVGRKFITFSNINTLITGSAISTFAAWGLCFIFASGITDFSIGAVMILSATAAGVLGNQFGYVGLALGGIIVGIVLLFINFKIYNLTKIPSWIAGLGIAMIYEAITAYYSKIRLSQGLQVVELDFKVRALGQSPAVYVVLILGFVLAYFIYNRTSIGLNVRAIGSNEEVAKMMGIKVQRTLLMAGIIAGFFFGAAGFVKESYAGRVIAMTGLSSISTIFLPLAAVLLSQVLQKYMNIIVAIPIATFFISAIFNMLTLSGVPSGTWQETILGLIVILFGMIAQRKVKGVVK